MIHNSGFNLEIISNTTKSDKSVCFHYESQEQQLNFNNMDEIKQKKYQIIEQHIMAWFQSKQIKIASIQHFWVQYQESKRSKIKQQFFDNPLRVLSMNSNLMERRKKLITKKSQS